ncbi:hypothetical protein GOHSU_20_00330 [Gordonia hirsuta DSM 44140 = NBRC 16056]|uniref:RDD domain-containing protein n=1 Tax=Gordonia hirsuta DSM 44140 = NBRC 16056 TaxID=1121927 RepID=L7L9U5_9ACTN|nr:RDD family protein [Gordonia hirsuta]GAC57496.1 hypothetical protein GOHSU_20_00330 [Gordonia hirsuta DSM 44140 = NBRC 16056]
MSAAREAGIVSRVLAAVIDLVVVLLNLVVIYAVVVLVAFIVSPRTFHLPQVPWVFTLHAFFAVAIGYQALCWQVFGRTIGQLVMGLAVVRRSTPANPYFLHAVGRAALCTVFPLGLAWVVLSRKRRAVHDLAVRTRVVYR